jgi:hypothetical protein
MQINKFHLIVYQGAQKSSYSCSYYSIGPIYIFFPGMFMPPLFLSISSSSAWSSASIRAPLDGSFPCFLAWFKSRSCQPPSLLLHYSESPTGSVGSFLCNDVSSDSCASDASSAAARLESDLWSSGGGLLVSVPKALPQNTGHILGSF